MKKNKKYFQDHNQNKILITEEGLKKLQEEYDELVKIKRPEVVKRVARARESGDLAENSAYANARETLSFIDGRVAELEEILKGAVKIAKKKKSKSAKVDLGCKVYLNINGKEEVFTIVGEWEANPAKKKISHESPLGKALIGKRIGEEVEVDAPAGKILYRILKIE